MLLAFLEVEWSAAVSNVVDDRGQEVLLLIPPPTPYTLTDATLK